MPSQISESRSDYWRIREVADYFTRALRKRNWTTAGSLAAGPLRTLIVRLADQQQAPDPVPTFGSWTVHIEGDGTGSGAVLSSGVASLPWAQIKKITVNEDSGTVTYVGQRERLELVRTEDGWRVSHAGKGKPGSVPWSSRVFRWILDRKR